MFSPAKPTKIYNVDNIYSGQLWVLISSDWVENENERLEMRRDSYCLFGWKNFTLWQFLEFLNFTILLF